MNIIPNNFIGIDLGTTNSVICSYDGEHTRIWKSPEQNDVTPSAIHIDRRGHKFVGKRAYDSAPHSPDDSATLFKRLMGTSTPIKLHAAGRTMSPEECSAEVLRTLFGQGHRRMISTAVSPGRIPRTGKCAMETGTGWSVSKRAAPLGQSRGAG